MSIPEIPIKEIGQPKKQLGFFSIFPIIGRLLGLYGSRLLDVNTLVALEKKQGNGSGQRTEEEDLLDAELARNKRNYQLGNSACDQEIVIARKPELLEKPVLYVKGQGE